MSIASSLKAELLMNGRIRPAEFCVSFGCNKDSVRHFTRQLIALGLIEQTRERGNSGRMIEACVVTDWNGLQAWEAMGSPGRSKYRWDGLMHAFGVNLRNIRGLPTTQHVIPWSAS